MICYGPGPRAWGRAAGSEARAAQRGRTGTSSPPCTAGTEQITLRPAQYMDHSEDHQLELVTKKVREGFFPD